MNQFVVSVPNGRLDLARCVSSGQVFRWQRLDDDSWLGADGESWFVVTEGPPPPAGEIGDPDRSGEPRGGSREGHACRAQQFCVRSNGTAQDFGRLFRLDWDADEIEREIAIRAPELQPYLGSLHGLRLLRHSDPVETFFTFLCTPNNNIARISSMVRKLAAFGPVMAKVEGVDVHRFPSEDRVATIEEAELRSLGFGYRAATIPAAARQLSLLGGREWLESLKSEPYETAWRELVLIKGIGRKLADCICLFGLHHNEVVPVDTHIWQALCRLYFPDWCSLPLTDKRYEIAASHFRSRLGELTGWAHQYLFYDNVLNWRKRN